MSVVDYIGWGLHVFLFVLALPGIVQRYADGRQSRAIDLYIGEEIREIRIEKRNINNATSPTIGQ